MKKSALSKILKTAVVVANLFFLQARVVSADIINPVTGDFGDKVAEAQSGGLFTGYFVIMWNNMLTVGGIMVLLYFIWGAIDWIISAGDKGKLEAARNKMMHAFIGLLLLVTSYTLIGFIGNLLFDAQFNILKPLLILNN